MSDANVKLALRAVPSVESDGFECYWLQDADGRDIGSINGPQCPETEALANKAAAAPEMYEALKQAIVGLDAEFGPRRVDVNFPLLRTAIAKAEAR